MDVCTPDICVHVFWCSCWSAWAVQCKCSVITVRCGLILHAELNSPTADVIKRCAYDPPLGNSEDQLHREREIISPASVYKQLEYLSVFAEIMCFFTVTRVDYTVLDHFCGLCVDYHKQWFQVFLIIIFFPLEVSCADVWRIFFFLAVCCLNQYFGLYTRIMFTSFRYSVL